MATTTKFLAQEANKFYGPDGNSTTYEYSLVTNSSGAVVGSDNTAAAMLNGDVVRFGKLPAGMRLHDALVLVSDAFTASVTASIGFQYCDGVDSTDVPQDADYFGAGFTLATAGRYPAKNTAVRPVTLPKDAWIIATIAGADNAAVGVMDVLVKGELVGVA